MDAWAPAQTLADQLTAAGVRATTDPDDAHPPVALVAPAELVALADGAGIVTLTVSVVTAGLQHRHLAWLWRDALPTVLDVAGADSVTADVDAATGVPVVLVTVERHTE